MNKKNIFSLVMFAVLSLGCTKKQISSDLNYYNLLKDEPIQEELDDEKLIKIDSFTLSPHYHYKISAKVLSKKDYSDKLGSIAPIDLALGWNIMSDNELLEKSEIKFSQSNRFYFWRVPNFTYLKRKEIEHNSANVHIIPSNEKIEEYLTDKINEGDNIYLEGYLVDLAQDNNKSNSRKTSSKRTDTGAGACEILYVTKVMHLTNK